MAIKITLPERLNPDLFPTGGGISVKGNVAFFDPAIWTAEKAQDFAVSWDMKMDGDVYTKSEKLSKAKAWTPDEYHKNLSVQKLDINPDDFIYIRVSSSNTKIDRDGDFNTKRQLEAMANFTNVKGAMALQDHNPQKPIGPQYFAEVAKIQEPVGESEHYELIKYFVVHKDKRDYNAQEFTIEQSINAKLLNKVSERFRVTKSPERVEVSAGVYAWKIDPPEGVTMVDNPETSFVSIPAVVDAGIKSKDFTPVFEPKKEPKKMEFKIKHFTLKAEGETPPDVSAIEKAFDELEAQLKAEKEKNAAMLQPSIDGILATQVLFKEAEKELDITWTEEELKSCTFEKLQAMHSKLVKSYQSEVKGIDPKAGKPAPDEDAEKTKNEYCA